MKIIHFSDTHLGFSDLDKVDSNGVNQREADFYDPFSDVIDAIVEQQPNYVIHTGDLFHRTSPSNRDITFALAQLKKLKAFHTIKEQYRQIFLISYESEIKEMFESVVEL